MLPSQTNIIKCSAAAPKESNYVFAGFSSEKLPYEPLAK
jgi:hypothetical protein